MHPHWKRTPDSEPDWFEALANLARYLRSPEGCPWDREQSAEDFARFVAEEAGELVEAFEQSDDSHIAEEFGDTLFVLLAAAAAAEEEGRFLLREALERAHEKMIRRHDHVFGDRKVSSPEEALAAWEEVKTKEKADKSGGTGV
jgi:tetrapyrrole methylase family protein/MazG family protein